MAVAEKTEVRRVAVGDLKPNPHNPRMLFDRRPMDVLKRSIRKNGVLVPLTVYVDSRSKKYIILDGQRRWMCAQEVGLEYVPVNIVAEPTLVENIVTMFQIHKLREDWELMPSALKIELLMDELGERNTSVIAELTGLDEAVVIRCKKLLSFDRRFQELMLDPDPEARVKADFFIELHAVIKDRDVNRFAWFDSEAFTDAMLEKYLGPERTIRSVTDFRRIKQYCVNARRSDHLKEFSKRLERFAEQASAPIAILEIEDASIGAAARDITKRVLQLRTSLEQVEPEVFYGEEELWDELFNLRDVLDRKLKEANRRRVGK